MPPENCSSSAGDLAALQSRLGWSFRDLRLLELALTHPSVAHGQEEDQEHNQRLEFLGDTVLSLVLTVNHQMI